MEFVKLEPGDRAGIRDMSRLATEIVREHFDPIIGKEQNEYMLKRFQTEEAVSGQLEMGYRYYFVKESGNIIGFLAFYPKDRHMYLSKFYLKKDQRRKGYAHRMCAFVEEAAKAEGLMSIELNVNRSNDAILAYERLGFTLLREEKNDIGSGFFMDDFVLEKKL